MSANWLEVRYAELNRDDWNRETHRYQERHRSQLVSGDGLWGPVFGVPGEKELQVLGAVENKDVLELGCGGGQWTLRLARQGARCTGQDISDAQIEYARDFVAQAEIKPPGQALFQQGNAEDLSAWPDESFDIVFSNFGAVGFVDIEKCFKEVGRVLRKGGLFAFSWLSPFFDCLADEGDNQLEIVRSYFDRQPMVAESVWPDGSHTYYVQFHHTLGDWQQAIKTAGLLVVDIIELEPQRSDWRESTWTNVPWYKVSMVPGTTIWRAKKPSIPLSQLFNT
ncbi:MAG: class I SAM-dependent methyltransferase [Chloroflexi bacterium]|nr:class I SAM-dependent methyltransferase [Chloroflexota bacterium]